MHASITCGALCFAPMSHDGIPRVSLRSTSAICRWMRGLSLMKLMSCCVSGLHGMFLARRVCFAGFS